MIHISGITSSRTIGPIKLLDEEEEDERGATQSRASQSTEIGA